MKRIILATSILLLVCFYANAQSKFDLGFVHEGVYINAGLGFQYRYPKDWTVHGDATNERIQEVGKQKMVDSGALSSSTIDVSMKYSHSLLTVFRHPLGTPGITFNPAILVLAERIDHAPGVKNGKDYLLNVRTIIQKAGAQVSTAEPTEYRLAEWLFFRDNCVVEVNGVKVSQSIFASTAKGYAVVFIFMGDSQAAVDEMAKSMETLKLAPPPVRRGVTTIINEAPSKPPPPKKPN
jgi:hypothetical protein